MKLENVKIEIKGKVVPITPLTQSPPSNNSVGGLEEIVVYLNKEEFEALNLANPESENKRYYRIPVFTANALRGRLRREVASLLLNSLKNKGEAISFELVNQLRCGAGRSKDSVIDEPLEKIEEVLNYRNPFLGLFGGGLLFSGRLFNTDLYPLVQETWGVLKDMGLIDTSTTMGELDTSLPRIWNVYRSRGWMRSNEWASLHSEVLNWFSKEELEEIRLMLQEKKEKIKENKKNKKAGLDDGEEVEVNLQQVGDVKYISPGTELYLKAGINNANDLHLGLLLKGWEKFAENPFLGGYKRWGFGFVKFNFDVFCEDEKIGEFSFNPEMNAFQVNGFDSLLEKTEDYIDKVKVEDLDWYKCFNVK